MRLEWPRTQGQLRREASRWLARLESERPGIEERFRRWYESDPRNRAAFDKLRASYGKSRLLRNSDYARDRTPVPRKALDVRPGYKIAATIAAIAIIPAAAILFASVTRPATAAVLLATRTGEMKSVRLPDGTRVILDTQTVVAVADGGRARHAELRKGRARFLVAAAPSPFSVTAGPARLETHEASFDVELEYHSPNIAVGSGLVSVMTAHPPALLKSGESASARPDGSLAVSPAKATRRDWTSGMLEFDATPLAQVVVAANRYSSHHIVVADEDIGSLKVTGAFREGDTAALAQSLARAFKLTLNVSTSGDLQLSKRSEK